MIPAVIDTNVIVSGLYNSKGIPAMIVDMIYEDKLWPVMSGRHSAPTPDFYGIING